MDTTSVTAGQTLVSEADNCKDTVPILSAGIGVYVGTILLVLDRLPPPLKIVQSICVVLPPMLAVSIFMEGVPWHTVVSVPAFAISFPQYYPGQ